MHQISAGVYEQLINRLFQLKLEGIDEHRYFSEVDIKLSLQNLTGTRLSALFAQNDVTIIKTATVLDNPILLRDLINTYTGNVNRANALIPRKQ